jgi:small subunit ribosomal protein S24e
VEIRILEERANPLLKRREYSFEVSHATAATPKRDEVRGEFAKLAKAPKDRVIIERMRARYGTATTRGEAMVYETTEAAKTIEREHILVRNGLKERATKSASPTPEPTPPEPAKAEPAKTEPAEAEAPAPAKKE